MTPTAPPRGRSSSRPAPDVTTGRPVVPSSGRLAPLGLAEVRITDGFWARRQETNRTATLAHIEHWLDREGWLANFDAAAQGGLPASRRGREFSDSEIYKLLEAMSWELGRSPDAELEARFHAIVRRVANAQEPDGYLSTMFGRPGQGARYSDLEWGHELYCQGHLMQAAVARARTGHADDLLVQVARRSADHVCETFGPDGNQGVCGHAEIEVALVELGRALDEPRYVRQAALFVERRGHGTLADIEWGRSYYQDDVPVRDATVFRGHAVRANYLAAGAVDVGVEQHDDDLLVAVARQWERTTAARTYITGGQGSHHQDEAFGEDFVLPPDRAYSETCASIGSVMVAWRLLLAEGEPRYADAIERALFNVVATSPAPDGHAFYYANTLHQRVPGETASPDVASRRAESSLRAPWFEVSCCPPNVARTFASLAAYVATVDDGGVQVHQYATGEIRASLPSGAPVHLDVLTGYPVDGRVRVRIVEAPSDRWALTLRVPSWSPTAVLSVDGRERRVPAGSVAVPDLRSGSVVELELDMTPRFVQPDDRIDAIRGCVAVQRGPEVLCLESVDLPGGRDVADLRVDASVPPREEDGRVTVRGVVVDHPARDAWPYVPADDAGRTNGRAGTAGTPAVEIDVPLVRYHDWANRGPSTMRIWMPVR
ncbi:glycoside hydrolase family 127 protein [Cellulosimicrobium arenosum]|uniref:Glycoside hydrolase family 127 protein n=2 Tax=Cellulosimicrobium arenosum TaxID=2708133 RepID=A0A927J177_9MICO|nr:beta-L-arabinofuranosidase domain-containing protein [Cellulosimicrobium arenosum]MBD8080021.1 glycoside hydrolase family 127 protein [Cellulosimicrobium arenosum]